MTARTLTITDAARSGAELPTMQRMLKASDVRVIEDASGYRKVILDDGTRLTSYAMSGKITARQHEAGTTFAKWAFIAQRAPGHAQSFDPPVSGGSDDMADDIIAAKAKLRLARNMVGAQYYAVLIAVCWEDVGAARWASAAKMAPQVGMELLRGALDLFADTLRLPQ